MNKFQSLDVDKKHKILSILTYYTKQSVTVSDNYEQVIKEYIQRLKVPNDLNNGGIITKAENVNCVINSLYWLDTSLPENSYVAPLVPNIVAIIFDDNAITRELAVSAFYSCVILTK